MSSPINKVISNLPQAFTTAEQAQARQNIDAQKSIAYSYSGSTITAIDNSAVGNPAALTGVDHDYNLSGSGTSAVPLGLNDPVKMSAQHSAGDPVSSMSLGHTGLKFEVPSAHTSQVDYHRVKVGYEWPSALDVEHSLGWYAHGEIDGGSLSLSAHDCSYISHNVITGSTNNNPYLGVYGGYGSGSLQTSIVVAAGDQNRNDPYISFGFSGSSEIVDQSSIRRWNAKLDASASSNFLTGVSANNNLSGNGSSGSPLGLNSQVVLYSSDASESGTGIFNGQGIDFTANPYTSTHYRMGGWGFYSNGDATHHHQVAANVSGIDLNWNTNYYVTNIHASGINQKDAWAPSRHSAEWAYTGATLKEYTGVSAIFQASGLTLCNSASGAGRTVSISDIDRWNSYSSNTGAGWNESGNSLSTGWGGNQVTAASQFNSGAGNWAVRRVKMSGIPDQDLIGFQALPPTGTGSYQINAAGAFVAPDLPTFNLKVYKPTDANLYLSTSDYPAMPSTADGLLILVNLGSGPNVVYPDTLGTTSTIGQHNSAQLIWDSDAHSWVRWNN